MKSRLAIRLRSVTTLQNWASMLPEGVSSTRRRISSSVFGWHGYTDGMLETNGVDLSVEHLLSELWSRSNTLVDLTSSKARIKLDLKNELETVRNPLVQLQRLRALHPAKVTAFIRQYAPEVGEVYETVMDVSAQVDACNQADVIDLAREIRGLLEPVHVSAALA